MAKLPLSSYPKEFLDMWELAYSGKLSITNTSKGVLVNLRQRMYSFRKRLLEESPVPYAHLRDVDIGMPEAIPLLPSGGFEIKASTPDWKLQVRQQVAHQGGSAPLAPLTLPPRMALAVIPTQPHPWECSEQSNICIHCGGYELDERHRVASLFPAIPFNPPAPELVEAKQVMDETLKQLGFSTEEKPV